MRPAGLLWATFCLGADEEPPTKGPGSLYSAALPSRHVASKFASPGGRGWRVPSGFSRLHPRSARVRRPQPSAKEDGEGEGMACPEALPLPLPSSALTRAQQTRGNANRLAAPFSEEDAARQKGEHSPRWPGTTCAQHPLCPAAGFRSLLCARSDWQQGERGTVGKGGVTPVTSEKLLPTWELGEKKVLSSGCMRRQ